MVLWNKKIDGISSASGVNAYSSMKKTQQPQQASAQSGSLMDKLNGMDNQLNQGGIAANKKKKVHGLE